MTAQWSTAQFPAHRQFAAWRDICEAGYYPLHAHSQKDPAEPFRAGFHIHDLGDYTVVDLAADGSELVRRAQDRAPDTTDTCHLLLMLDSGAQIDFGRRPTIEVEANSVLLFDPNESFRFAPFGTWRHRVIRLPRALANSWIAPKHRNEGILTVSPRSGVGALLAGAMQASTRPIGTVAPQAADITARMLCELLSFGVAETAQATHAAAGAVRGARLDRARRIIERRLGEADLTPAMVATELRISLRAMHMLFEPTGRSFTQYLVMRRTERAAGELREPSAAGRTIADIAFAAGFADLTTFHRTFRRQMGLTPGDYRAAAATQRRDEP